MAVLVALVRGLARKTTATHRQLLGRSDPQHALHPAAAVARLRARSSSRRASCRRSSAYHTVPLLQATKDADGKSVDDQVIAVGPGGLADRDQEARHERRRLLQRELGAPVREPDAALELRRACSSLLVIPAALTLHVRQDGEGHAAGLGPARGDVRRLPAAPLACASSREQAGNPALASLARRPGRRARCRPGGNMEGKEVRFGISAPALFATATTGGLVRRGQRDARLVHAARRARAAAGSSSSARSSSAASAPGCTACSMFAIVAVFVAGLMVGRTPEYLGKKIEAHEMKMASLVDPRSRARRCSSSPPSRSSTDAGRKGRLEPRAARVQRDPLRVLVGREQQRQRVRRAHRRTRPSTTRPSGLAMFFGRFFVKIAGRSPSRARSRRRRSSRRARARCRRTRRSSSRMLVGVIVIVGALTFIPALALGPIVEQLLARS